MIMNTWKLEEFEFHSNDNLKLESLFSQGNGYLGWRGTFEEGIKSNSLEGTYINGFYESFPIKHPEIAYGYPETGQSMLNLMNGKIIQIFIDKEMAHLGDEQSNNYYRGLDFRSGVLTRSFSYRTKTGKEVDIAFKRLISFKQSHCAAIHCTVIPRNFSGSIIIRTALSKEAHNQSAGEDPRVGTHLPANCFEPEQMGIQDTRLYLSARTKREKFPLACAVEHDFPIPGRVTHRETDQLLQLCYEVKAEQNESVTFTKYLAYYGKADSGGENTLSLCMDAVSCVKGCSFAELAAENQQFLDEYWNAADIQIEGDDILQQGLRFNGFHIIQSVGRDGKRSIAAKGLSGEGYEGHYFWDTEMYVIPSLLYSNPKICRELLSFRYYTLDAACRRAREMGHKEGALYPWRTIGGVECSSYFPGGTAQYHINGDIALAIENYTQATGDQEFLLEQGADILFQTARLWYDLGHYSNEKHGKFCIDCVTGPDEYTAVVNNNFYTNRIARENLWYASYVYNWMHAQHRGRLVEIKREIGLRDTEPELWKKAGDDMYFPYDKDLQIDLQDDSFSAKAEWDFKNTPKDQYPLLLHFHPLVIYRHKVLKQADTVLADFILDKYQDAGQIKRNYDYYESYTTHDSSLSACVHSIMAARIGYLDKAYNYFMKTARMDLDDKKGNTKDGLHIANMAGASMCIINGFGGLRQWNGNLILRPVKPEKWRQYSFKIRFQGSLLQVTVADEVKVTLLEGREQTITLYDKKITVRSLKGDL